MYQPTGLWMDAAMKLSALSYLFLLLAPALALAQNPPESTNTHDAQILWEFDTGG